MKATGKCLCGTVRLTAENVDPNIHACHCSMCRAWAGGPVLGARVGSVHFEGEDSISRYDSSDWGERGFCSRCGSNLFFRLKPADNYIVSLGVFSDPTPFKLADEIYIDEKPDGYAFAGEHPRMTGAQFLAMIQNAN